ncbi:hypothetical protein ABZ250_39115 [Streptomyces afghaniensis]|uniref:hypothetical protein n=1 Tax=Streptomyces afghaniensis TaxID=66865 RepID=UPI0033A245A6
MRTHYRPTWAGAGPDRLDIEQHADVLGGGHIENVHALDAEQFDREGLTPSQLADIPSSGPSRGALSVAHRFTD